MRRKTLALLSCLLFAVIPCPAATDYDNTPSIGPAKGWLVIQGGGALTNELKERFVALAGGPNASFVVIPTAQSDTEIDAQEMRQSFVNGFRVSHVTVLHTRDRARANSDGFVEPLRHASGVWIDGGRQWRLADAYLGTAVEREVKALLARGGVVGGGSAGATIQGSFLVRGEPGNTRNPDGDNRIMMSPGHESGFGLLASSAIDQHVDTRGREADLDPVIASHPNLLGIGIDQSAAIVVHGDSFFVVGGRVVIHDGKKHDGSNYYSLSPGESFNLRARTAEADSTTQSAQAPLILVVNSATRHPASGKTLTLGTGRLDQAGANSARAEIKFQCNVSLFSAGSNRYPARLSRAHQFGVLAREVDSNKLREFACKF